MCCQIRGIYTGLAWLIEPKQVWLVMVCRSEVKDQAVLRDDGIWEDGLSLLAERI